MEYMSDFKEEVFRIGNERRKEEVVRTGSSQLLKEEEKLTRRKV